MSEQTNGKTKHDPVDWVFTIGELSLYAVLSIPRLIAKVVKAYFNN
ncbi:hypothetical protein [Shouchella shacheensis]|nr:hypothetical protein [Shouchella shacheensis]